MATINNRSTLLTDPLRNFRFLVTFQPQDSNNTALKGLNNVTLGFTSVSGLAVTTDSIPYREGGYNTTVHQIPGQTSFTPLTLQRGVILGTRQNWDWMKNLFATVNATGSTRAVDQNFRCDIEIAVFHTQFQVHLIKTILQQRLLTTLQCVLRCSMLGLQQLHTQTSTQVTTLFMLSR